MDKILQIEILLDRINILLAKSVTYDETNSIDELEILRRKIYYEDFDYKNVIQSLKKISGYCKKHE